MEKTKKQQQQQQQEEEEEEEEEEEKKDSPDRSIEDRERSKAGKRKGQLACMVCGGVGGGVKMGLRWG
jgi:uncharacterized membrane protein YdbT with pleckstrin-like domain